MYVKKRYPRVFGDNWVSGKRVWTKNFQSGKTDPRISGVRENILDSENQGTA